MHTLPKREIKFRAWDSLKKEWLFGYNYPNLGGFSMFGEVVLMGEWGNTAWDYISKDKGIHLHLTQYTGIKDKNEKEIWEGDIMRIVDLEDKSTFTVVFVDGAFRKKYDEWDEGVSYPIIDSFDLTHFEVIGNIFENPELIESK